MEDLFILRKHDVINISKAYPSMWNKIYDKSMYNMTALSKKTVQILKRYCSCHGIILNKIEPKKSQKLDPLNLLAFLLQKMHMETNQKNGNNINGEIPAGNYVINSVFNGLCRVIILTNEKCITSISSRRISSC